jgi:diketogulonate reductase-like aldo/keto reductase
VGLAIKETGLPRSSLYITTKYSGTGTSQEAIQQSLNKVSSRISPASYHTVTYMLVEIGVSYLDLYLVHFPVALPNFESGWQEFEKMKKDGLARCAHCNSNMIR